LIETNALPLSQTANQCSSISVTHQMNDIALCMYDFTNRCSERSYPARCFHHRVTRYRIDDLNPPPIEMMRIFCEDVDNWLSLDPRNVVAVHCHAGKVRATCRPSTLAHSRTHSSYYTLGRYSDTKCTVRESPPWTFPAQDILQTVKAKCEKWH